MSPKESFEALANRDPDEWPRLLAGLNARDLLTLISECVARIDWEGQRSTTRALELLQASLAVTREVPQEPAVSEGLLGRISELIERSQSKEARDLSLRLIPLALRLFPTAPVSAIQRLGGSLVALSRLDQDGEVRLRAGSILRDVR